MTNIDKALQNLNRVIAEQEHVLPIPYDEFLNVLAAQPSTTIRNVFQLFYDMIMNYVGEGKDEYPDDPETINYVYYDTRRLFIENSDQPFFADRLFTNRLINHVEAMRRGKQQNKIYIFEGPAGSGKSTFLNNLLTRFEEYTNTEQGVTYETVWRLDRKVLGNSPITR